MSFLTTAAVTKNENPNPTKEIRYVDLPRLAYILFFASGRITSNGERKTMLAATAETVYIVYASTG